MITAIADSVCDYDYAALAQVPDGFEIVTAEFKVNLFRTAVGVDFLASGKVVKAGKLFTVCAGEVQVFNEVNESCQVAALMQAGFANVSRQYKE